MWAKNAVKLATGIEVAMFVRDYDAVKRAVEEAGPIDVLILNHGVFTALELEKMELSENMAQPISSTYIPKQPTRRNENQ
ncbi:hypothetical protein RIF29_27880 [Crotalaria pallida]|uniref:Uncharacterized protein n=1 Tax=Crotalaria pallida TaxID=3830 RepID=A0AAN9I611_CROPI